MCYKALESLRLWDLEGWAYLAPSAQAGTLHFIGLLSDGGVHSRYDQLHLLLTGVRTTPLFTLFLERNLPQLH